MALLEFAVAVKALDEHIETLKYDLLFSMSERKLRPENASTHKIITIKRELDKAAKEKIRLIMGMLALAKLNLSLLHNIIKEYSSSC